MTFDIQKEARAIDEFLRPALERTDPPPFPEALMHYELTGLDYDQPTLRGGQLDYITDRRSPRAVPDHKSPELKRMCRSLFDKAEEAGEPLRMLEIRYSYEGGVWRSESSAETMAEYHDTTKARALVDDRAVATLQGLWEDDFKSLSFAGSKVHRVMDPAWLVAVSRTRGRLELEAPESLRAIERELYELYQERGRRLYSFDLRIRGPNEGLEEDPGMFDTYYG